MSERDQIASGFYINGGTLPEMYLAGNIEPVSVTAAVDSSNSSNNNNPPYVDVSNLSI